MVPTCNDHFDKKKEALQKNLNPRGVRGQFLSATKELTGASATFKNRLSDGVRRLIV